MDKGERLREVIAELQGFRLCGPGDDPDRITNVVVGYRYQVVQLRHLAKGVVPQSILDELAAVDIDVLDIYSVYEAKATIDALIPDIEDALDSPPVDEPTFSQRTFAGLLQLLYARGRGDLVAMLGRSTLEFDVSSEYGSTWNAYDAEAVFLAPIEDCDALRGLPDADVELILNLLRELSPPRPGDMDLSTLAFVVDPDRPTVVQLDHVGSLTGWERVDRCVGEIRDRLRSAGSEEQYQSIGHLCRETLISAGQAVYDPKAHPSPDDLVPSRSDVKRMLGAYFEVELKGSANKEARKHARASLDLANQLQHDRTASRRDAMLCAEATLAVTNILAILSGKRDAS